MILDEFGNVKEITILLLGKEHTGKSYFLRRVTGISNSIGCSRYVQTIEESVTLNYTPEGFQKETGFLKKVLSRIKPSKKQVLENRACVKVILNEIGGCKQYRGLWRSAVEVADAFILKYNPDDENGLEDVWNTCTYISSVKKTERYNIPILIIKNHINSFNERAAINYSAFHTKYATESRTKVIMELIKSMNISFVDLANKDEDIYLKCIGRLITVSQILLNRKKNHIILAEAQKKMMGSSFDDYSCQPIKTPDSVRKIGWSRDNDPVESIFHVNRDKSSISTACEYRSKTLPEPLPSPSSPKTCDKLSLYTVESTLLSEGMPPLNEVRSTKESVNNCKIASASSQELSLVFPHVAFDVKSDESSSSNLEAGNSQGNSQENSQISNSQLSNSQENSQISNSQLSNSQENSQISNSQISDSQLKESSQDSGSLIAQLCNFGQKENLWLSRTSSNIFNKACSCSSCINIRSQSANPVLVARTQTRNSFMS